MTFQDIAFWFFRCFGALYAVGGVAVIVMVARYHWLDKAMHQLEQITAQLGDESEATADPGRNLWLAAGGVLTSAAGVAMVLASRWSVWLLAALVVHQVLYFWRQHIRESRARSEAGAEEARPTRATVKAFNTAAILAVLSAWLNTQGLLT